MQGGDASPDAVGQGKCNPLPTKALQKDPGEAGDPAADCGVWVKKPKAPLEPGAPSDTR